MEKTAVDTDRTIDAAKVYLDPDHDREEGWLLADSAGFRVDLQHEDGLGNYLLIWEEDGFEEEVAFGESRLIEFLVHSGIRYSGVQIFTQADSRRLEPKLASHGVVGIEIESRY